MRLERITLQACQRKKGYNFIPLIKMIRSWNPEKKTFFFSLFCFRSYNNRMVDVELNAPESFTTCNNEKCSTVFKYLDVSVHTIVDGPDPRDHLANERNLLTWIRTGTTLSLVGE